MTDSDVRALLANAAQHATWAHASAEELATIEAQLAAGLRLTAEEQAQLVRVVHEMLLRQAGFIVLCTALLSRGEGPKARE